MNWADLLEAFPLELQGSEKKQKERKKKAQASEHREEQLMSCREQKENERLKSEQKRASEAARVDKALQIVKSRAKDEGVLEAQEYADGLWYVEIASGTWKQVACSFWCRHCEAALEKSSLASHLHGEGHINKSASKSRGQNLGVPERSSQTPSPMPTASQQTGHGAGPLESWQTADEHGNIHCIPCGKCCDGCHETTLDHKRRVRAYLWSFEVDYSAPAQPWLAWVECNQWGGGRWLKCLLCKKWVQDFEGKTTGAYQGTHGSLGPGNQQEHRKKLVKLDALKQDASFWNPILEERQKCHPNESIGGQPALPTLTEGWKAVWSQEHGKFYFHNGRVSQWEWPNFAHFPTMLLDESFEC